jgi:heme/copper-type cytochrome/quinol oxidase subunit 2|tara:strand:+ start:294 stop:599 length:306 start_codon:yes stop_codon:yes gene_type:complete
VFGTDNDIEHSKNIYVPSVRLVKLMITSDDYIYFFRVPDYKLRQAAIPDLVHEIPFEPDRIGVSNLEVDPICSPWFIHQDSSMGNMHIWAKKDFVKWLSAR